jgi:hypothetical protein
MSSHLKCASVYIGPPKYAFHKPFVKLHNFADAPAMTMPATTIFLKKDLDYPLLRASMVVIFLFFGYQKWFQYKAQALIPY